MVFDDDHVSTPPKREPDDELSSAIMLSKLLTTATSSSRTSHISPHRASTISSPKNIIPIPTRSFLPIDDLDAGYYYYTYSWETPWFVAIWNICLAVTGFLDFIAALADHFYHGEEGLSGEQGSSYQRSVKGHVMLNSVSEWLVSNAKLLGFLFAIMWFLDSFMSAHHRYMETLRAQDREQLLLGPSSESEKTQQHKAWWKGANAVYFTTIALQLLLLPVGFYVMCYAWIRRHEDPRWEILHRTGVDDDGIEDVYEEFSREAQISLGFALVKHVIISLSWRLGLHVRKLVRTSGVGLARRVAVKAVRNPFRFRQYVLRTLRFIRWIKYLAPLIGAGSKLNENITDLAKKHKQKREAYHAHRIRQQIWSKMTKEELREFSATLIQKTFRANRIRLSVAALQLRQNRRENAAAHKVQTVFRKKLKQARLRLKRKKEELRLLEKKEKENILHNKPQVCGEERRRMYELQMELHEEADALINEKLLLRPNTTFAVAWKVLFVVAVIFEISQLACQPILARYKNSKGKPLELEPLLQKIMTPSPVSELPECAHPKVKRGLVGIAQNLFGNRKRAAALAKPLPWYCESTTYAAFETTYRASMHWSIHWFLTIMGVICFLDVYIAFFTGDFNPVTGILEPKPVFKRWVLPGICLQLLVNPTMGSTSALIVRCFRGLRRLGAFRVLRWTVALFYPLTMHLTGLVRRLWLRIVSTQNEKVTAPALHPRESSTALFRTKSRTSH